jgi:hypothetical protein
MNLGYLKNIISENARRIAKENNLPNSSSIVDQIYRDRFLTRVYLGSKEEWILKGGSGILARVPNSRRTVDIDLFSKSMTLEDATNELIRLSSIDIRDGFNFEFICSKKSQKAHNQPYKNAISLIFGVFVENKKSGQIKVDLVSGIKMTGQTDKVISLSTLSVKEFQRCEYLLYPLANQISDKICASIETHNGMPSSRVKDLVDIIILITHFDFASEELITALNMELAQRKLLKPNIYILPSVWKQRYEKIAKETIAIPEDFTKFESAVSLGESFVNSVLNNKVPINLIWNHKLLKWQN